MLERFARVVYLVSLSLMLLIEGWTGYQYLTGAMSEGDAWVLAILGIGIFGFGLTVLYIVTGEFGL